jgi:hypothetical protein
MTYSLRRRKVADAVPDSVKKAASPKKAKIAKAGPSKPEKKDRHGVTESKSESLAKDQNGITKAPSKTQPNPIIRPSLPISDAKQRLIKELSIVKGKPSEIKENRNQKKKILLHKIDLSGSGKIQKKSRPDKKQLSKILFTKIQQQPNIQPSVVKARANPAIVAINTEILKKSLLKEIRQAAGKKSATKSPVKSPLKGR